jgi:hypothetical protein
VSEVAEKKSQNQPSIDEVFLIFHGKGIERNILNFSVSIYTNFDREERKTLLTQLEKL